MKGNRQIRFVVCLYFSCGKWEKKKTGRKFIVYYWRLLQVTQAYRTESMEQEGGGKIVVELKGKCFNASLTIEKHEQRCPWCQEEQDQQLAYVAQPVCLILSLLSLKTDLLARKLQHLKNYD